MDMQWQMLDMGDILNNICKINQKINNTIRQGTYQMGNPLDGWSGAVLQLSIQGVVLQI